MDLLVFILCAIGWILLGQGVFLLHVRAGRKDVHGICLFLWPLLLLIIVFADRHMEW